MFGVGLHFSIKDLWAVRKIAIPGAIVQITAATVLGMLLVTTWGWSWGAGLVFGLCLSVASTVVLLRAVTEIGQIETANGRIAVGWLIVEDLATVVALVALPALSVPLGGKAAAEGISENVWVTLGMTLAKVGVFVAAMLVLGKSLVPRLLGRVARTGSRELFTLGVLAVALGIAFGASELFGVSPALGAFFAGVVISESDLSHQAGAEILPLQETFTVLFFVSVGMMFDPSVLINQPIQILGVLAIVLVGKSIAAALIMLLFRFPLTAALMIAASLAQIGEFSFILIALGIQLELVPPVSMSIILAVAIISIALNPAIFSSLSIWDKFFSRHPKLRSLLEGRVREYEIHIDEDQRHLTDHAVMIGYGRVGTVIGRALDTKGIPYVVVDLDRTIIDDLNKKGVPTIFGDASRPGILRHAGLRNAKLLVIATPAKSQIRQIVNLARKVNPDIEICVRTHSVNDSVYFEEMGIQRVVMGELELALEMAEFALRASSVDADETEEIVSQLRDDGAKSLTRSL